LTKRRQRAKTALGKGHRRLAAIKFKQGCTKGRNEHGRKRLTFRSLNRNADETFAFRGAPHLIEENGLPDAAQAS